MAATRAIRGGRTVTSRCSSLGLEVVDYGCRRAVIGTPSFTTVAAITPGVSGGRRAKGICGGMISMRGKVCAARVFIRCRGGGLTIARATTGTPGFLTSRKGIYSVLSSCACAVTAIFVSQRWQGVRRPEGAVPRPTSLIDLIIYSAIWRGVRTYY